jgi:acyl-coenzyme A thioesterase PaaI-like protein
MEASGPEQAVGELSIQERLYPHLTCFGCGHANPRGLKLRSYPAHGEVVADFRPRPEHDNGFGFLNGGIIATVLDCHSGAAVFDDAARRGQVMASGDPLLFVTAGLDVRYLRPVPLRETLRLRAVIEERGVDRLTVQVDLEWDDKTRATAIALWKRWRSR